MDAKELVKVAMRYEMCISFLNGLLKDEKLTETEFEKAAKHVADQYDIETVKLKLVKLKYPNMQSTSPLPEEAFVYKLNKEEVDIKYISLTDLAKKFSDASPSYVVQSWMRSSNTIELLNLWEQRHNDKYSMDGYDALVVRLKTGTFTMTPKQWIVQTGAIGITSKSGKNGGTYAHPLLACEFMMWLCPEYKLNLLENLQGVRNE